MSWAIKYRPKTLDEVVGQPEAVKTIKALFAKKFPKAVAFTGGTGTGKSTLAFIVGDMLGAVGREFEDINCASVDQPLDFVRDMEIRAERGPIMGKARVFCLQECQSMSRTGFAMQALLPMMEAADTPKSYFLITTTDPSKIHAAVMGRCTKIELKPISNGELHSLALNVLDKEGMDQDSGPPLPSSGVLNAVIANSNGSARNMLALLEKVAGLSSEEEQLNAITPQTAEQQGIDLARLLLKKARWPEVAKCLRDNKDEPETIRRIVLAYMEKVLLGGSGQAQRAFEVIQAHRDPTILKAELAACCWEVSGR
jgi:DNA polymerase III gamma/tau subunit